MKKILVFLVLALIVVPTVALAAVFRTDGNIPQSEVVLGNVYLAGGSPVVAGTIQGDLYIAGGNIVITGNVDEDLVVAGGNISITGTVGGDLRAFGGTVRIDGRVDGEVLVSGGEVVVGPNAIIRKDILAMGGNVNVHPNAQIFGSSRIYTDKEVARQEREPFERFSRAGFWGAWVVGVIAIFVVAAVYIGFFGNVVTRMVAEATRKGSFWKLLGLGFLIFILTPIAAVISLMTGIGFLLGLILLLSYILILMVSVVFAAVIFGGMLKMTFGRGKGRQPKNSKNGGEFSWGWLITGIVVLQLIGLIPVVGGVIVFVMMLYALGTIATMKWKLAKTIK